MLEAALRLTRSVRLLAMVALCAPTYTGAQEPMEHTSPLHGFLFGDLVYVAREQAATDGFFVGQVVAHGSARLSGRLTFFGEISATARAESYVFEVERAILRYDFIDQFKLSAGRYHTPISYWNTAFHHGLWLQTSVARPEIIKVGGRFMPVHFIGVMAEGKLSSEALGLSYEAGLGNGRGLNISRAGDAGDLNRRRAAVVAARLRPGETGLQLGGGLYLDRVTLNAPTISEEDFYAPATLIPTDSYNERIATGHLVWDRGAPEIVLEYSHVRHERSDTSWTSDGWYAHAAYALPGKLSRLKPYARLERLDADSKDPVFGTVVGDYRAVIGGLRYDFESLAALKAEYRREQFAGGPKVNGLYLQIAFAIPLSGAM